MFQTILNILTVINSLVIGFVIVLMIVDKDPLDDPEFWLESKPVERKPRAKNTTKSKTTVKGKDTAKGNSKAKKASTTGAKNRSTAGKRRGQGIQPVRKAKG